MTFVKDEDLYAMSSFSSLIQQEEQEEVVLLDLHTACLIGDYDVVRDFIERQANINKQNLGGWTPLMYASYVGRDNILNLLLEAGAKTEIFAKKDGLTALMLASYCATESIMYFLLQYGAHINARDNNGMTSLFHAVRQGHKSAVKLLLTHGADLNLGHFQTGLTPLMEAAISGHEEIFSILLENGADLDLKNNQGANARALAVHYGHVSVLGLIDKALITQRQQKNLREEPKLAGVDVIFHPGVHESNISEGPSTIHSLIQAASVAAQQQSQQQIPVATLCPDFTRLTTKNQPVENTFENANADHFSDERYSKKVGHFKNDATDKTYYQHLYVPESLQELLEELSLETHLAKFESQLIDISTFLTLNDADLREIGIDKLGPRKKILMAIAKIKQRIVPKTDTIHGQEIHTQIYDLNNQLQQSLAYIKQLETQLQNEQHVRMKFTSYLENEQQRLRQILFYANDVGKNCKEASSQIQKIKDYNSQTSTLLQQLNNNLVSKDFTVDSNIFETVNLINCESDIVMNRLDVAYKQIERTLALLRIPNSVTPI
ncbi:ankyrin repeat and SAM domain-containing protein 3 isoform X3 [Hydra vulgaris]|uniref:Ankyrin repeat and SAM domain-containing protein 3 isoform X3 n=1 Tax=Hydra vulgaris TaxID=6087 RepID=A0ABM4B656_HYDVU